MDIEEIDLLNEELEQSLEVEEDDYKEESLIRGFCYDVLEGLDDFKLYMTKYMGEFIKELKEEDDLNYYDWLFHQHLRDGFISYAKYISKELMFTNSKRKELTIFLDALEDTRRSEIDWFTIFQLITSVNGNKNFAKYIRGDYKDA